MRFEPGLALDDKGDMSTPALEVDQTLFKLHQRANYWQTMHGRAVAREQYWKGRSAQLEAQVSQHAIELERQAAHFEAQLRQQATMLEVQAQQIEALKARVAWLQQQVFGRKSEGSVPPSPGVLAVADDRGGVPPAGAVRGRGQQRGAKGHGRQRRVDLPTEEIEQALPVAQQQCPQCGLPLEALSSSEDSEEIHWEVRVVRRVHRRRRYRPSCRCGVLPGIVTAPVVAKVIRKGLFSTGFWVQVLLEKYLFQRPLHRVRQRLALEGLSVSPGTLTGGLQRLGELIQPLVVRILERSRQATHWQMDETRWLVFAEVEGKEGHQWWLWVVVTADTCVYLLDPSRSAEVPRNHLGEAAEGIISADRFSAYKTLGASLRIAFCWSHIRRDFVRLRDGYVRLRGWADAWVHRINELFGKNQQRLALQGQGEAFARADQDLRAAVTAMAQTWERQLTDWWLPPVARKALESLRTHWPGATLFVDHPQIPMDNNQAERALRNPVVGRKNYYGSGAVWSGQLSALLFTLFQTYLRNQLDPQQFLLAYFDACAHHRGQPPENLDPWLPWNVSPAQKHAWAYPKQPP